MYTKYDSIGSLRKQYQDIKIKFSSLKHNVSFIASSVEAIPDSLARNEKATRKSVNTRSGVQTHTEQVYHNKDNTYYNGTCVIKGVPVKELRETVGRKSKSDTMEREFKVSKVNGKSDILSDRWLLSNSSNYFHIFVDDIMCCILKKLACSMCLQEIPYGAIHPTVVAQLPENMPKNRFKTTFPCTLQLKLFKNCILE